MKSCPCGSGKEYSLCCGPFITGLKSPSSPEELMRSRYSAYTMVDVDYLRRTMKPPAANHFSAKAIRHRAKQITWLKLEVLESVWLEPERGFVTFRAYYKQHGKSAVLQERSEFILENGSWYYVDGKY